MAYTNDTTRKMLITSISKLDNLETISFTGEKPITTTQTAAFANFLFGGTLIYLVHGTVIAGVSLSDTTIEIGATRNISITLAAAKILSVSIDETKSQLLSANGNSWVASIQPQAYIDNRVAAQSAIMQEAIEAGILEQAKTNAISDLQNLFQGAFSNGNIKYTVLVK